MDFFIPINAISGMVLGSGANDLTPSIRTREMLYPNAHDMIYTEQERIELLQALLAENPFLDIYVDEGVKAVDNSYIESWININPPHIGV
jgi:hypothetical protein